MATLNCNVPSSLMGDLTRAATDGESLSHIVTAALSQFLNKPIHTLFQVSTSGALVGIPASFPNASAHGCIGAILA